MAGIAIVIPARNEAERIGRTVSRHLVEGVGQIVVADGGSTDCTAEVARLAGADVVDAKRGRAAQMNAGAAAAREEYLIFLHADTVLPEGFPSLVREALTSKALSGGAFSLSFRAGPPGMGFVAAMANFRARRLGVTFGDQAIFTRREDFGRAGGYPDQPIMEDYEFVCRLRRLGRFSILPQRAETSARRWGRIGLVRTSAVNVLLTWAYRGGASPETVRRLYRRWIAP